MKQYSFLWTVILIALAGIILSGCKKDQPSTPPGDATIELEFVIEQTDFGNLKSTLDEVPQCNDQWSLDYVVFAFASNNY